MNILSINWYQLFYWITRADAVKEFFDSASNIFTWFTVILFIGVLITGFGKGASISDNGTKNEDEDKENSDVRAWTLAKKYCNTLFYSFLILSLITWAGYVFTPTKKEALLIAAGGGIVTYLANDSLAKQLPHELFAFTTTELKSMAADAKVDLGIATQKDKILEQAKTMTASELMDRMKVDSNFAKIILNK